ncbi:BamA/TamA family outer membrane protein [Mucilaginibacter sp. PAMB04274]|uniref:BamA/TamA family outer membrane protein n=1 Tax=Mucilaginibacter sp. PAMB04274 TaxID=3138568 RepID=UPI0031F6DC03
MFTKLTLLSTLMAIAALSLAQSRTAQPPVARFSDSVIIKVHPSYDSVSGIHRWLFGENYRKEWATPVKLPLIKVSEVYGGLKPLREGGGMQSKSLRLVDKQGKEWVIRSVEKTPEKILPPNFKGTFAVDWIDDALSSQHPFSALVVPPLADAAGVPHANPIIGVMAPDAALGEYSKVFNGLVVLLEEREPTGKSDNTIKMMRELKEDNDTRFNSEQFVRARMLDLLLADWDRHEDQWRWGYEKKGNQKVYYAVPRDRDQVFHLSEGIAPSLAALPWINPTLDHFDGDIPRVQYSIFKTRFIQPYPDGQISYADWMRLANEFVKVETDAVLEAGLKRLPPEMYKLRHDELLAKLKQRRNNIPAAMDKYYRFINETVDLRTTDKNERINITDAPNKGMRVQILKSGKSGNVKDAALLDMVYNPAITREIRLYVEGGNDEVVVNNSASPIKLRIIGTSGRKNYNVTESAGSVKVYGLKDNVTIHDNAARVSSHLSNDTSNTRFVQNNPYNVWMPLATAAINADDGFLLGLGFKHTRREGFRKLPYASVQQLLITHSFATEAFRIRYNGEWIDAFGRADFTLNAFAQAPDNTLNFFGRGNQTVLNKFDGYRRYYRTRYDTYQIDPALRWHTGDGTTISAGPSIQFFHLDLSDNTGRFISNSRLINSYDSATVNKDKAHVGLLVNFISNRRNNNLLPSKGYYLNVTLQGYTGLNEYSRSFIQIKPEFTYYQKLNASGSIVVSNRVGGGVSIGKPAFYQSMFLGGQGNLLGYLQNRFAGDHMVYNNLQARAKLFDIASYVLPGQLGITGFYDAGRVWVKGESSDQWHTGTGGGLYFSPASLTIFQLLAGHSKEGWYPYISLNFRL